ncbi:MAG TPA: twin-arginine translocase TatA/TatE family subunit [Acidobacteriaceae bacterium]
MPSLQDSAIIFVLALLLFGPKKLPVLARELGKWIGEFRRASNEFKMQMEEELRISEQTERQEKIAAMEAAAPVAPVLEGIPTTEPEHPHQQTYTDSEASYADPETEYVEPGTHYTAPLPIATSGELSIMPPATGLPTPQTSSGDDIGPLIESIPVVETAPPQAPHLDESAERATHVN